MSRHWQWVLECTDSRDTVARPLLSRAVMGLAVNKTGMCAVQGLLVRASAWLLVGSNVALLEDSKTSRSPVHATRKESVGQLV